MARISIHPYFIIMDITPSGACSSASTQILHISCRGRPLFKNHSGIIEERPFLGINYTNIKEAEKLVRNHLSDQIGIKYHPKPPVAIYGFNPDENYLLFSEI